MLIYILFVSGVVLANASLDIAFHDTAFAVISNKIYADKPSLFGIAAFIKMSSLPNIDHNVNDFYKDYIKMFWVGLMDGDGSIQVNHSRAQLLQYRLIIKLSNLKSNYNMLIKIAKVIGGTVRITANNENVIWVVDSKKEIEKIIKIFDTYPPITSKKICQLAFLKACLSETSLKARLSKTSLNLYMSNRKLKYDKQLIIIKSKVNFNIPSYFKYWLSGFIEAKGCFSLRENKKHSFSIGQNDDRYLITAIKQYFRATNIVRNSSGNFYSLEVYKKEVILRIITHCTNQPLLGEKLESLKKLRKKALE